MKQENKMTQKMNQVNPKAGTLKQTKINWTNFKSISRKLIASVMMLAVLTTTPGVVNAGTRNGDTCCSEETTSIVKLVKAVKLTLPSQEALKRADSEAHRNLFISLRENKMKKFAEMFTRSDADMNVSFKKETMITVPEGKQVSDENISNVFQAENIDMSSSFAISDNDIKEVFQAENDGIKMNIQAVTADDQITNNFLAENINIPGSEIVSKADAEIQKNLEADNTGKYAKK